MGDGLGVVDSLLSLATVGGQIEPELAARVLGSAIALREQLGATPTRRESTELAAAEAAILSHADPDATDVAASVGEPIQENDAVALGLRLGALIRDAMSHMLTEVTPVTGQADRRNQRGMA
jgi:hypothetical protein